MHLVRRRWPEVEMLIECSRIIVLGMQDDGPNSGDVGSLQCAQQRIFEQPDTQAPSLSVDADRQPRQYHQRDGVTPGFSAIGAFCPLVADEFCPLAPSAAGF